LANILFVLVRLCARLFEGNDFLRGRILGFKTGATNHSTIPPRNAVSADILLRQGYGGQVAGSAIS